MFSITRNDTSTHSVFEWRPGVAINARSSEVDLPGNVKGSFSVDSRGVVQCEARTHELLASEPTVQWQGLAQPKAMGPSSHMEGTRFTAYGAPPLSQDTVLSFAFAK